MSEKKRKRGRPRMAPALSYGTELKLRNKAGRVIKKPKYLRQDDDEEGVSSNGSPLCTQDDIFPDKLNASKSRNSRGYNPQAYDKMKDSEYHYGSDFELEDNSDGGQSDANSSSSDVSSSSDMDESDGETVTSHPTEGDNNATIAPPMWWKLGPAGNLGIRAHTPVPVWLQDRIFPPLDLPKSSDDLLIPTPLVMKAIGIYEVLRHFRTLVRLSPFHFEDFCATLLSEEQSVLLTEIHIALLKALIREEESQQTHFGPIDQKDSINIMMFFIDSFTWPEVLRLYLQSDSEFKQYLKILDSCNYPYTSLSQRLDILQFLCDQFLQTAVVREDLISEGKIKYDDHCRFCHKTGDLLCCDSCSAVYHLECVDPPLMHSPAELDDWTCAVCKAQEVEGVTDCLSPMETSGFLCRQEPLGYDRHGRKYWFLIRRIFVESEKGEIWYYSSTDHLDLILLLMDKDDLEEGLFIAFKEFGDDIRRQMKITEELTNKAKGNKPAWLLQEREQFKEEKELLLKMKLKKEDSEAVDRLIEKVYIKDEVKEEKTEGEESASKESKEGSKIPEVGLNTEVKMEVKTEQEETAKDTAQPKQEVEETDLVKLIQEKRRQLSSASCQSYRLGCDTSHRAYSNIYVTNALALNKLQHNEERDKKRHLSHKFSLTSNSEFKWNGVTNGTPESLTSTVRATLLALEGNVSSHYFHPHWQHIRKTWSQFAFQASEPTHFSRALRLLAACIKPVVFSTVWNESLGHIRLKRITAAEREERKKQEKKEKKEAEDESRLFFFIKYTKGVKHQLWKVKGEEYRLHGLWGWLWNSSQRRTDKTPMAEKGLRAGPDKVTVPIKTQTGVIRGLPINPTAHKQLASKNKCLRASILSPKQLKLEMGDDTEETEKGHEIIIANAGIQQKVEVVAVNLEEHFEDGLINVSKSLNSRLRLVYPKVAKSSSTLDGLLTRRIGLKLQEERELALKKVEKGEDEKLIDIENGDSDSTLSESSDTDNIEELPDSQRSTVRKQKIAGNLLKEINTHKQRYEELDKQDATLPCYSVSCRENGRSNCYSPLCMLKERAKQKLVSCVNNYKIVTSNSPPFEQVGVVSPIRFDENDLKDSSKASSAPLSTNGTHSREGTPKRSEKSLGTTPAADAKSTDGDDSCTGLSSEHKANEKDDRVYSTEKPCGKVYLKKYNVESKRTRKTHYKFPPISSFKYGGKGSNRNSLLVLSQWELRLLARKGGKYNPLYFNPNAKINQAAWPYPCSRPLFKTTWLYRTTTLPTVTAAALQLRIIWACLRWDDMQEKGPSDGRRQVTTEMEIIQTEILKRKYSGRFMEKTEYLQRKVIIPFDVPKPVREFTPSQRSGLRKRRRAQSPVSKQPQSLEEWVEEEKLPLWEIKYFGERLEKAAVLNKKAAINDKTNGDSSNFQSISRSTSPAEFKAKIEEQLKIQRATFNQKKAFEVQGIGSSKAIVKVAVGNPLGGSKFTLGGSPITIKGGTGTTATNSGSPIPSLLTGRKIVTTKGGKIITVQATPPANKTDAQPAKIALGNSSVFPVGSLPKVQVTPQGNKVIRFQTLSSARQRSILPRVASPNDAASTATTAISSIVSTTPAASAASPTSIPAVRPAGQQIHIIRLPDGQVQVRGLQDGQQVIQRSDGKLHFVNKSSPLITTSSTALPASQIKSPQKENTLRNISPLSTGQIVKINGQQVLLRPAGPNGKQIVGISTSEALTSGISTNLKTLVSTTPSAIPFKAVKTQDGIMIKTPISISSSQSSAIIKSPATDTLPSKMSSVPSVASSTATTTTTASSTSSMLSVDANVPSTSNSLTLRVQVRMTEQGPKTIIQGLEPGVGLTKDHIMAIQQQVRSMLSQYNLQVNQLSPLMTLTLQMSNKSTSQSQTPKASPSLGITAQSGLPKQQKQQAEPKPPPTLSEPVPFDPTKKITSVSPSKTVPENIFEQDNNDKSPKKFVVTDDYIQQNVEERLVQFQKYTCDKTKDSTDLQTPALDEFPSNKGSKRNRDQEEDWDGGLKSKPKKAKPEKTKGAKKETPNNTNASAKTLTQEAKKKVARQQKLEGMLSRHKDLLKKDILKKRALLEKELQLQIHKELTIAKQHMHTAERSKQGDAPMGSKKKSGNDGMPQAASVTPPTTDASNRLFGQKKNDSLNTVSPNLANSTSKAMNKNSNTKNKRASKGKNKKIVCICRTPFDDTKFYVGCDMCGNWFHGDCVGITEALSRTMTEYVCDDCANAKLNKELFCFCRQPYDEAQFYIFCEKCEGWYHGKCIGIMQQEAEDIDDYICPQCDPNTEWNKPCQKKLTGKDHVELKKIAKTLIQHKNAWPFLEPVDQSEVPDYYKVVKEPMDLKTVESKVAAHSYTTVAEFCGDVMLVFDNCRAYNPPNSSFWSCANALENFFCNKLKQLKQKVSHKS